MGEAKGVVKHVLLLKFKEDTTSPQQIDQVIRDYGNLVDLIPPMNSFVWESTEGVAEYLVHPAHIKFANLYLPLLDKFLVFDYKPTVTRNLWPLTPGISYVLC